MSTLARYLGKLQEHRVKFIVESVENTTVQTAEKFSYIVGYQAGLKQAMKLFNETLEEEKKGTL